MATKVKVKCQWQQPLNTSCLQDFGLWWYRKHLNMYQKYFFLIYCLFCQASSVLFLHLIPDIKNLTPPAPVTMLSRQLHSKNYNLNLCIRRFLRILSLLRRQPANLILFLSFFLCLFCKYNILRSYLHMKPIWLVSHNTTGLKSVNTTWSCSLRSTVMI